MTTPTRVRVCLAVVLLALAGCGGLRSKDPPMQTYVLQVGAAAVAPGADAGPGNGGEMPGDGAPTLAISRPTAASGLDNERIAVIRADGRLDYFNASRWAGDLPDVLQTLLLDSQRASGRYRAVMADTGAFSAIQLLEIEVRQFQAEYGVGGPPTVHVVLEGTLGLRGQREVLRTLHAESRVPAGEDRLGAVVAAFNSAVADALTQLRSQTQSAR